MILDDSISFSKQPEKKNNNPEIKLTKNVLKQ